jgi:hypothetical protein
MILGADIVLFLFRADFRESEDSNLELLQVKERKIPMIAIMVEENLWPYIDAEKWLIFPRKGNAVSTSPDRDAIWTELVKKIESIISKTETEFKEQVTDIKTVDKDIAYLLIDLPVDMNLYNEALGRVCIDFDKDRLLRQNTIYGNPQIEEIKVSDNMRVELANKPMKKTKSKTQQLIFDIQTSSDKEQSINKKDDDTEVTEWLFEIKPNHEGEFVLILNIGSVDDQKQYKKVASFDREIEVHGNKQYQTSA